jgi:predicted metal-binding membrane protein
VTAPATVPVRPWHREPQWWLWGVALVGWAVLLDAFLAVVGPAVGVAGGGVGSGGGAAVAGHGHHGGPVLSGAGWGAHAAAAVGMVAVMAPLITPNVRFAARRSPRWARGATTRDVVAGWALVWLGAAVVLGIGGVVLVGVLGELPAIALATVGAVGWQYSARKRRALARCHAVLAPPLERARARRACRAHGIALGRDCVVSCWPLMALMAVAAHDPLVVAAAVGVAWYERRRRPHHDPATRATAVAIAAAGVVALAVAELLGY